ncbi:hypothetical protein D3C84_104050 [compost metagenome]
MQVGDKMYIPVVITELDKWDSKNTAHVTFADGMGACSVFTETLLTAKEVQEMLERDQVAYDEFGL